MVNVPFTYCVCEEFVLNEPDVPHPVRDSRAVEDKIVSTSISFSPRVFLCAPRRMQPAASIPDPSHGTLSQGDLWFCFEITTGAEITCIATEVPPLVTITGFGLNEQVTLFGSDGPLQPNVNDSPMMPVPAARERVMVVVVPAGTALEPVGGENEGGGTIVT